MQALGRRSKQTRKRVGEEGNERERGQDRVCLQTGYHCGCLELSLTGDSERVSRTSLESWQGSWGAYL